MTTAGPFVVERHGRRWTVTDLQRPDRQGRLFTVRAEADAYAERRNRQHNHTHPRATRPTQPSLYDQET